jgi:hypothetical protein
MSDREYWIEWGIHVSWFIFCLSGWITIILLLNIKDTQLRLACFAVGVIPAFRQFVRSLLTLNRKSSKNSS